MPKNKIKTEALVDYENTIRQACDVRREAIAKAQATFKATKMEAQKKYDAVIAKAEE